MLLTGIKIIFSKLKKKKGTPIQNNMAELWALLHFIMPSLFDSHEEFNEWFSKDIENHAKKTNNSETNLNELQLQRLHMILKPFMLRRVKKDVESELPKKEEKILFCKLSLKQKEYYKDVISNISKKSNSKLGFFFFLIILKKFIKKVFFFFLNKKLLLL
jgi:SNF2 family DNA or RNA helicase